MLAMDKSNKRLLVKRHKEALRKAAMYERHRLHANVALRNYLIEKAAEYREIARDIQCQLNGAKTS